MDNRINTLLQESGGFVPDMTSDLGMTFIRTLRESHGDALDELREKFEEMRAYRRKSIWTRERFAAELQEAFSADALTILFGDAVERQLLPRLQAVPPVLTPLFSQRTVSHVGPEYPIRTKQLEGWAQRWQQIARLGEYTSVEFKAKQFEYNCMKYGRRFDWALEDMINDDLGAFDRLAQEIADGWNNTVSYLQTNCFVDANGWRDAFFADAEVGQGGVTNTVFSIANLKTAFATMMGYGSGFRSIVGEPIKIVPRYIVTGTLLTIDVEEVLASLLMAWTDGSGAVARHPTRNVLEQKGLVHIADPWIDILVTTGTLSATSWALFADPAESNGYPGEWAKLTGHEGPELFYQSSNSVAIGGGATGPFTGSFANDSLAIKGRGFAGCATLDPRMGYASDGQ